MPNEKIKRGMITEEIKKLSKELLGAEISQLELRLLPYVQYTVMNGGNIIRNRINKQENQILKRWQKKGWLKMFSGIDSIEIQITKEFWNQINQILWLGYASQCELISEGGES